MNGQEGPALRILHLQTLFYLWQVCHLAVELLFQGNIDLTIHDFHLIFLDHVFRPW